MTPTYTEADGARDASEVLDHPVAEAFGPESEVVQVEERPAQRRPAHTLTEAAAQLVVVGSHGRGELLGIRLGSVATFCVHHAPSPVLVARAAHTGR